MQGNTGYVILISPSSSTRQWYTTLLTRYDFRNILVTVVLLVVNIITERIWTDTILATSVKLVCGTSTSLKISFGNQYWMSTRQARVSVISRIYFIDLCLIAMDASASWVEGKVLFHWKIWYCSCYWSPCKWVCQTFRERVITWCPSSSQVSTCFRVGREEDQRCRWGGLHFRDSGAHQENYLLASEAIPAIRCFRWQDDKLSCWLTPKWYLMPSDGT